MALVLMACLDLSGIASVLYVSDGANQLAQFDARIVERLVSVIKFADGGLAEPGQLSMCFLPQERFV